MQRLLIPFGEFLIHTMIVICVFVRVNCEIFRDTCSSQRQPVPNNFHILCSLSSPNLSTRTMYEPNEKKHYLCLCKNKLVGRYLLQDNTKPAWHTDKRSLPERVQDAVDEMVMKVDEIV